MSNSAEEKSCWGQVMENFDLLFTLMNDIGIIQQEVKQQLIDTNLKVAQCTADQQFIAQQVRANGQAVAQLTLRQFEKEAWSVNNGSVIADEEVEFENVFAHGKAKAKPEPSHHYRGSKPNPKQDSLPHHALPKMQFPSSDGTQPKILLDKCNNYFSIYSIPKHLWVEAATMHLQDNAAKWWQTYKVIHPSVTWQQFSADVQEQFGSDDYRSAINEL